MNKERRQIVGVLARITDAYTKGRNGVMPPKVLMVIRDAVKEVQETEMRSAKKMEPFKDNESTQRNYINAIDCAEDLYQAIDALEEGDLMEALHLLSRVAEPPAEPKPTTAAKAVPKKSTRPPARTTTRKSRSGSNQPENYEKGYA